MKIYFALFLLFNAAIIAGVFGGLILYWIFSRIRNYDFQTCSQIH